MPDNRFDVIVIGSGPGGASLAQRLAPTGKKILILERGDFLKRSIDNWSPRKVFIDNIYQADETWHDKRG
ncbi:MAG: NAD(P)-binding protein, partial [Rhodanobacteraceae bacterium]